VSVAVAKSLRQALAEVGLGGVRLGDAQIQALERHLEMLVKWNRKMNLTSLADVDEIVRRHYAESLWLGSVLPAGPLSIADVGSGAGFPGYPIAVLRPESSVALIESSSRKAVFLRQACRGIENLKVIEGRAEDCRERFDWLVARGVAWRDLAGLVGRLADCVGVLVGEGSVRELQGDPRIAWREPLPVPWMERSVAMLGTFHVKHHRPASEA
jgi:16S rRNA (guanine(527)-N(7))-methyltransferase RsmG